jgi:predicted phage terminase large subunit-like protein
MVLAPTYAMLSDATFRMFEGLSEELGILEPSEVKRSAPPSIRLRTGAEVLFRSADEPDRLRGPNLSGVWMDEASLMHLDAFTIAIGRLREAGEQGWLSATLTPKGRNQWCHDVFATGRPNTAIFHCRTADNPFLPEGFHDTVRQQYTSALAEQELKGRFVDLGGALFRREWFAVTDRIPPLTARVRAWDLAATPEDEKKSRDPDWCAGVLMGKAADRTLYVLDVRRLRGTPQQVQSLVISTAQADGPEVAIVMEEEGGSSGKIVIADFARRLCGAFDFRGVRSTGSKTTRASPLAAAAEAGLVKLASGPFNRDFLDEFELFPLGAHDDIVDAASLAAARLARTEGYLAQPPELLTPGYEGPFGAGPFVGGGGGFPW